MSVFTRHTSKQRWGGGLVIVNKNVPIKYLVGNLFQFTIVVVVPVCKEVIAGVLSP